MILKWDKWRKQKQKVKMQNFLVYFSVAVMTVFLIVISIIMYNKTKHFMEDKIEQVNAVKMSQAVSETEKRLQSAYRLLSTVQINDRMVSNLDQLNQYGSSSSVSYQQVMLSQKVEQYLMQMADVSEIIKDIVALTPYSIYNASQDYESSLINGLSLKPHSDEMITFVPAGKTYDLLEIENELTLDYQTKLALDKLNQSAYFTGLIKNKADEYLGMVLMFLDLDKISASVPYAENLLIMDSNQQPLFHGEALANADISSLTAYLVNHPNKDQVNIMGQKFVFYHLGMYDFDLIFAAPTTDLQQEHLRFIALISILFFFGCALISYVSSRYISKQILNPLHVFIRWIRRYDMLNDRFPPTSNKIANITMRDRFFIYFMITILIPLLLFILLFYSQTNQIVKNELVKTYETINDKTYHRINQFLSEKETALNRTANDPLILESLKHQRFNIGREMDKLLYASGMFDLHQDIVTLYDMDYNLVYSSHYKMDESEDMKYLQYMNTHREKFYSWFTPRSGTTSAIHLAVPIFNISAGNDRLGFLMIRMDSVYLTYLYADLQMDGATAFISSQNGEIVSSINRDSASGLAELQEDQNKLYFSHKLDGVPWYFVAGFDYSELKRQILELMYADISMLIGIFMLVLLFSYVMSQYLLRPFSSFQFIYEEAEKGDISLSKQTRSYGIDEVEELKIIFNRMMERIQHLIDEKIEVDREKMSLEYEKNELQLRALQAQINPHFLHNTMEVVMFMIGKGENKLATRMLGLLSRLLRFAMGRDSMTTTIREEIDYVKSYITIMEYRFDDRFTCEWELEPEVYNMEILKMILQPVVENVLKHSVPFTSKPVNIHIRCYYDQEDIVFIIRDNGAGIKKDELNILQEQLKQIHPGKIGLNNVNSRIKLHFGHHYGLEVDSQLGEGTTVTILLPRMDSTHTK